jgi:hypothetical protein
VRLTCRNRVLQGFSESSRFALFPCQHTPSPSIHGAACPIQCIMDVPIPLVEIPDSELPVEEEGHEIEQSGFMSNDGSYKISRRCPTLSKCIGWVMNTSICMLMVDAGSPSVKVRAPRMDASGRNQLCERCGRRLAEVKHHRAYGAGEVCHPRCKDTKRPRTTTLVDAECQTDSPPCKRPCRANSDPGEPTNLTR